MEVENPFALFKDWFEQAKKNKKVEEATAMSLATATAQGMPNVRMVLLKKFDDRGFVFFTNLESQKGKELLANPYAALCFYWAPLGKQVRIQGQVELIEDREADEYFQSRPLESRIGAWASKQSSPMKGKWELKKNVAKYTAKFTLKEIPRPDYWTGFRLIPSAIEFWQEKAFRLHDRLLFIKGNGSWKRQWLFP